MSRAREAPGGEPLAPGPFCGYTVWDPNTGGELMEELFWCPDCFYTYDPRKGDPTQGIPPDTEFIDLPEDWVCPLCFNAKRNFLEGVE